LPLCGLRTEAFLAEETFTPSSALCSNDAARYVVCGLWAGQSGENGRQRNRTFKSEIDAKLFAMQILAKGWSASAGMLNPHQPRRIVGASQIERWADPGLGG